MNLRRSLQVGLAALAVPALLLFPGARDARAADVSIFAAASLKPVLDALAADPELQIEGADLRLVYAGSSALARQIQYGAPAQIFISANTRWMDELEQNGLLTPESRVNLLGNRLVLVAAPGLPSPADSIAALEDLAPGAHLAMGLVNAVPAGIYGREALQSLGAWEALQPLVVQGDSVRAALRLVASGEAEYGIVYATDPGPGTAVQIAFEFPAGSHTPIRYPIAMIGTPAPEVHAVYRLLRSEAARRYFAEHGFEPLAAAE